MDDPFIGVRDALARLQARDLHRLALYLSDELDRVFDRRAAISIEEALTRFAAAGIPVTDNKA